MPGDAKDDILLRLLGQGALHLKAEVLRKYRETAGPNSSRKDAGDQTAPRRTVAEILAAADLRQEARKREAAERAAKERERLEAERAAAREKLLKTLAVGETQAWARVDSLIAQKPAKYGEAVDLLKDLGEVCRRSGRAAEFSRRIRGLRDDHARKLTFIRRLDQAEFDR